MPVQSAKHRVIFSVATPAGYAMPDLSNLARPFFKFAPASELTARANAMSVAGTLAANANITTFASEVDRLKSVDGLLYKHLATGGAVPPWSTLTNSATWSAQNRQHLATWLMCVILDREIAARLAAGNSPAQIATDLATPINWLLAWRTNLDTIHGRNQIGGIELLILGLTLKGIRSEADQIISDAWTYLVNPAGITGNGDRRNLPEIDYFTPGGGNAEGPGPYFELWKHCLIFFGLWKSATGQDIWQISSCLKNLAKYVVMFRDGKTPYTIGSYTDAPPDTTSQQFSDSTGCAAIAAICNANETSDQWSSLLVDHIKLPGAGIAKDDGQYYPGIFYCFAGSAIKKNLATVATKPAAMEFPIQGYMIRRGANIVWISGQNKYRGYRSCACGNVALFVAGQRMIPFSRVDQASHSYWKLNIWGWPHASPYAIKADGTILAAPGFFLDEADYNTSLPAIPPIASEVAGSAVVSGDVHTLTDSINGWSRQIAYASDNSHATISDIVTNPGPDRILCVSFPLMGQPISTGVNQWNLVDFGGIVRASLRIVQGADDVKILNGFGKRDAVQITSDPLLRYPQFGGLWRIDIMSSSGQVVTEVSV